MLATAANNIIPDRATQKRSLSLRIVFDPIALVLVLVSKNAAL
jgi:hypothetical protein